MRHLLVSWSKRIAILVCMLAHTGNTAGSGETPAVTNRLWYDLIAGILFHTTAVIDKAGAVVTFCCSSWQRRKIPGYEVQKFPRTAMAEESVMLLVYYVTWKNDHHFGTEVWGKHSWISQFMSWNLWTAMELAVVCPAEAEWLIPSTSDRYDQPKACIISLIVMRPLVSHSFQMWLSSLRGLNLTGAW